MNQKSHDLIMKTIARRHIIQLTTLMFYKREKSKEMKKLKNYTKRRIRTEPLTDHISK